MPFQHTRKVAPRTDTSVLHVADLGVADTVVAIPAPEGAIGVSMWFDKAGTKVRGRVGFHSEDVSATIDGSDGTGTLGHQADVVEIYSIVGWGSVLHVASSTANASLFGTWWFD